MAEAISMRLAKAASTYNVSMGHVIEKLKEGGFTVENNPALKLTGEMVAFLDKAFGVDKAIKLAGRQYQTGQDQEGNG